MTFPFACAHLTISSVVWGPQFRAVARCFQVSLCSNTSEGIHLPRGGVSPVNSAARIFRTFSARTLSLSAWAGCSATACDKTADPALGMTLNRAEAVGRFPSGIEALPTPSGPRSFPSAAIAALARQDRGFAFAAFIFSARRVSRREKVNPPGRRNLHCRIEIIPPKGRNSGIISRHDTLLRAI